MLNFDDLSVPDDDGVPGGGPEQERRVRRLLEQLFGERADEVLDQMRAQGLDPAAMIGDGPLPDATQMQHVLDQVRRLFAAPADGPVNAGLAHDLARQVAVAEGDPSLTGVQAKQVTDALSVAELWLDAATDLPPSGGKAHAWSRSEWVEATLPAWNSLVAPVAASMSAALATVLGDQMPEIDVSLPGIGGTGGPGLDLPGLDLGRLGLGGITPKQLMERLGAAAFGMQVGQAAGTLSREVFGTTDVGLPLLPGPGTALLPTNVAAFADGLDVPVDEVRHYLAVREAAHARLFTHVPWVRSHLLGLVQAYARGISIDLDALQSQVRDVDPSDPSQLQRALSGGGLFGLTPTPEQQATLLRLETALALVEGWVDEVSAQAALPHLPHAVPLREMLRRRRAAGGPAEQTFASLVGLELRPRRSRDAAALFAHVYTAGGLEGRDAVWSHPDLLPDAQDLDNPAGYFARREAQQAADQEFDAALKDFLGEG